MTIDSEDDSKIANRTITTNRISNRTYDSKSNRITKLRRSLVESCLPPGTESDESCHLNGLLLLGCKCYRVKRVRRLLDNSSKNQLVVS